MGGFRNWRSRNLPLGRRGYGEQGHEKRCIYQPASEISDHSKTATRSALIGEPGKIREDSGDQIAMMSISRRQLCGI